MLAILGILRQYFFARDDLFQKPPVQVENSTLFVFFNPLVGTLNHVS